MASAARRHLAILVLGTLALAGCEEGTNPLKALGSGDAAPGAAAPGAAAPSSSSVRLVDRDVEAPEVFQITAQGLWDGRPSLGGVWVATSEAKDPERVIIRNTENGKFVIGALFKRERENPGPPIQISSDAAAALGLLAGQPGELNVTALRREEAAPETPDATQPILDTAEVVETETLDTGAVAAAIDEADAKKPKMDPAAMAATATAPAAAKAGAKAAAPAASEAAPAPAPAASKGKSLIQLGIFSVEANAKTAADMVTKAGAPATIRKEESKGKPYWSVVVGPANTPAEREALMKKVQDLGFKDAYFVSR